MKILVVGSGGREHAIVRKLKESPQVEAVLCAPGNGGISRDAACFPVNAMDKEGMLALAQEQQVDLVFVAPDDPLAAGMVDFLEAAGIPCFGPNAAAAQIEASKVFSKDLMKKYGIPTAGYEVFADPAAALEYIKAQGKYPAVIKADGLALGKGVVIAQNEEEAKAALHSIMEDKIFGESGAHVVVEEFLTGPEVSVLAFTDGKAMCPMVSSMDHKRAYDGDKGPNTGGMGTISPNPFYTQEVAQQCMERIFLPTMAAMNAEGRPFKGCLYFGLMLTPTAPKSSSTTPALATRRPRWCCPACRRTSPRLWRPWPKSACRSFPSSGRSRPAPAWSWPAAATRAAIPRALKSMAWMQTARLKASPCTTPAPSWRTASS